MHQTESLSYTHTSNIHSRNFIKKTIPSITHKNAAPKHVHTPQLNLKSLMLWNNRIANTPKYESLSKEEIWNVELQQIPPKWSQMALMHMRSIFKENGNENISVGIWSADWAISDHLGLWPPLLLNHGGSDQTDQWEKALRDSLDPVVAYSP